MAGKVVIKIPDGPGAPVKPSILPERILLALCHRFFR